MFDLSCRCPAGKSVSGSMLDLAFWIWLLASLVCLEFAFLAVAVFSAFAATWSCNTGELAFVCNVSAAASEHEAPAQCVNVASCTCCGGKQVHATRVAIKAMKRSVRTKWPAKKFLIVNLLQQELLNAHYLEGPLLYRMLLHG